MDAEFIHASANFYKNWRTDSSFLQQKEKGRNRQSRLKLWSLRSFRVVEDCFVNLLTSRSKEMPFATFLNILISEKS